MRKSQVPFKFYKRSRKSKLPVYYARYLQPDGTYTAGRTTGETSRKRAEIVAWEHIQSGKVVSIHRMKLKDFSMNFFDWEGEWAVNKRAGGLRISPEQCQKNHSIIKTHVNRLLGTKLLADFDTPMVRRFRNTLFREGLSGSTINKSLGCLKAILESAEEQHLLRNMPRFQRAALVCKERGILTLDEVNRLFSKPWEDELSYVANLVAASTGFRLSEIRGIRRCNVSDERITITGSFSSRSRSFKDQTKNGQKTRSVPIPPSVQVALLKIMNTSPWKEDPESYVFYTEFTSKQPMEHNRITRAFFKALAAMDPSVTDAERKRRNISFHSHRHFFNSLLVESRIPLQKIQQLTGHLNKEMTQRYFHIHDLSDVADVQIKVFDKVAGS